MDVTREKVLHPPHAGDGPSVQLRSMVNKASPSCSVQISSSIDDNLASGQKKITAKIYRLLPFPRHKHVVHIMAELLRSQNDEF